MNDTGKMNEAELLEMFGLTSEQVEQDARRVEDETQDDGIIGPVYYGLHMIQRNDEPVATLTVKMPASQLQKVTEAAKKYHISRSEYVRRKLVEA
ncbi:CopG family transcriptional regulator [Bifidobacterium eulemuris]|uniref:CopG family transcriptional regulator n=2 Tax=Bifidobacterium TaxID=1678 RepID=A0A261FIU8_9BIFI|nr:MULTISPECIES: CopG family transcriptional regulator [Bifidobacterium]OZG58913.1 CopG family transcriptional regulator [Bifidobacterium lemurum]OZG63795.1 CopG family transcriptional regulator [Bifidobacterium eulemuris]